MFKCGHKDRNPDQGISQVPEKQVNNLDHNLIKLFRPQKVLQNLPRKTITNQPTRPVKACPKNLKQPLLLH